MFIPLYYNNIIFSLFPCFSNFSDSLVMLFPDISLCQSVYFDRTDAVWRIPNSLDRFCILLAVTPSHKIFTYSTQRELLLLIMKKQKNHEKGDWISVCNRIPKRNTEWRNKETKKYSDRVKHVCIWEQLRNRETLWHGNIETETLDKQRNKLQLSKKMVVVVQKRFVSQHHAPILRHLNVVIAKKLLLPKTIATVQYQVVSLSLYR